MDALQYYPWLYIGLASLFGLLVGSFLNVVIYRLPK
ncbi:prepilin peptidase, partial [Vibrio vulnificus]